MSPRHEIALPTYRVTVAPGMLDELGAHVRQVGAAHRLAIISDTTVSELYGGRAVAALGGDVPIFTVAAGEQAKTRESWSRLTDALLAAGFGRDSTIVALGGGVVGDLAAFVASTYMRGVPVVQVPTTLLAMIDAALGGKTGVDTAAGKNLVGTFHQPSAVIVDPDMLATLPPAQLRAGLAEALKHGIVANEAYFDRVVADLPQLLAPGSPGSEAMTTMIARSVRIKADIVRRDERENGVRKVLNFGHTLGHAIESVSGYTLLHGEAVALGMALEARLAESVGIAQTGLSSRVRGALAAAGLPIAIPRALDRDAVLLATRHDKKARGGVVEYALPLRIGAMAGEGSQWGIPVPDDVVREVLARTE